MIGNVGQERRGKRGVGRQPTTRAQLPKVEKVAHQKAGPRTPLSRRVWARRPRLHKCEPGLIGNLHREAVRTGRRFRPEEGTPKQAIGLEEALRELLRRHEAGGRGRGSRGRVGGYAVAGCGGGGGKAWGTVIKEKRRPPTMRQP
jgi:hypothetical protein